MKKPILKLITLLLLTTVAVYSCSVEYRERHRHPDDLHQQDHHNDHHDYLEYQ